MILPVCPILSLDPTVEPHKIPSYRTPDYSPSVTSFIDTEPYSYVSGVQKSQRILLSRAANNISLRTTTSAGEWGEAHEVPPYVSLLSVDDDGRRLRRRRRRQGILGLSDCRVFC